MSTTEPTITAPVPPERLAEASVWIAKLHGDARGREIDNGLRRWLQEDPENARAFELATDVWEEAENLRRFVPFRPVARVAPRSSWPLVTAAAFGMMLVVVGLMLFQYTGVIATGVGEQRQVVLEDGTRVFLNTDTRIAVKYDKQTRWVELRRGEALFNVAKRSAWPFIVVAGDRQVKALGTSFVVRREAERVAVTLVEGSVLVSPVLSAINNLAPPRIDAPGAIEQTPAVPQSTQGGSGEFTLTPGQRLTFNAGAATQLDTPSVDKTTAWRRGQVILDDTPLQAAAAEMNRYNESKLVVQDPETAALPINGLFQAGDSSHFANAVAQQYGLTVIERGNEIVLSGKPVQ
jgi:transmembrane sensor